MFSAKRPSIAAFLLGTSGPEHNDMPMQGSEQQLVLPPGNGFQRMLQYQLCERLQPAWDDKSAFVVKVCKIDGRPVPVQ